MKYNKIKSAILILGDLVVFYLGLLLTLVLRYPTEKFEKWWFLHLLPFSALFLLWIIIFGLNGLYNSLSLSDNRRLRGMIIQTMIFSGAAGIVIFYLWPQTSITPKTNLLIDIIITTLLLIIWRTRWSAALTKFDKTKVVFFGWSSEAKELSDTLSSNPHLGYKPIGIILSEESHPNVIPNLPIFSHNDELTTSMSKEKVDLVVASLDSRTDKNFIKMLYEILPLGVAYLNLPQFYERITGKVPVSMISEMWFLENLTENEKGTYETIKRAFDILAGFLLGAITFIILPFAVLAIKLESAGPVFFRQNRIGKNGKIFELIKFRSKVHDNAWKNSGWNKMDDEKRTTLIGKILRKTYIDELPQSLNIIKGEMSLIGPRPERPEFVEELKNKIPHYMMRLLARPGISGWAQINMRYDASAADALEKLQYDLYYIKNRSLGLDISIALKTLFTLLSRSGK